MLSGIGHAQHLRDHGIDVARGPAGRRQPARPHVPRADLPRDHRRRCAATPSFFAKGVAKEVLRPGKTFLANSVFEVGRLRAYVAGDRRTRPAAAPAAVVLRLAQPGRADPPRRRPAAVAHDAVDADLPAQPRHPAAGVGRPDRGAADRLPVPRRPRRPRGARRGLGDGPRDHGRRGVRRRGQGGDPPRRRASRARTLRDEILNRATSVYHGVGTCRMGVDELRRRRPRPQGPRHRGAAGRATPRSCRRSPAATPTRPRS